MRDPDFFSARQIHRTAMFDGANAPKGQEQTEQRAQHRKQHTFHEQLANDSPSARAQGSANGHFLLAT